MEKIKQAAVSQPSAPEPRLDSEQRQRAMMIAESRGIDLETAQELVYLRDKVSQTEPSSDAREVAQDIIDSDDVRCNHGPYSGCSRVHLIDLRDRIAAALTSARSQLLKQIREAVEAEQVEDDGSDVWDAGHYDGINDALAAIDKVANETSET